jgi:hypothetical protein
LDGSVDIDIDDDGNLFVSDAIMVLVVVGEIIRMERMLLLWHNYWW